MAWVLVLRRNSSPLLRRKAQNNRFGNPVNLGLVWALFGRKFAVETPRQSRDIAAQILMSDFSVLDSASFP
jgi:hypothetical protein